MQHFMIVLVPYINLLNLSWIIKCLFLRNMEPLKSYYINSVLGYTKAVFHPTETDVPTGNVFQVCM